MRFGTGCVIFGLRRTGGSAHSLVTGNFAALEAERNIKMAINKRMVLAASTATLLASAGVSLAGGLTAPVVEPAPIAPVVMPAAPVADWTGAYAGASLGYSFSGDDENVDINNGTTTVNPGDLKIKGATGGVQAGYRWQNQNWVYGAEVSAMGGSVDDDLNSNGYEASEKMKYAVGLKGQLGYLVNDATLVYGTLGVAHGKFDVAYNGAAGSLDSDFSKTGYSVGLGVERKLSDKWSVRGQYEYMDFGDETVNGSNGTSSKFEPSVHTVSVGFNYAF